jgi:hypothetical protein
MAQKTLRRAFFLFLYLLIILFVLEAISRVALAFMHQTWGPTVPPQLHRFDPYLGWALAPGVRATSKRTGNRVTYCINAKGLRDDDVPYEKPEGAFRIVLVGDSRSFGFGVPIEQHFSRILEGYFHNLDVINMAVDGYGVDQELLMLKMEGFKYQPDLVMVYVAHYGNQRHLRTNVWGVDKPRFILHNGELVLENSSVRHDSLFDNLQRLDSRVSAYSQFYGLLRDLVVHIVLTTRQLGSSSNSEPDFDEEELHSLAEAIVLEMDRQCRLHDTRLLLLTAIQRLHDRSREAGILVHNVSPAMANPLFKLSDELGHFNEAGNGALAWDIAQFLKQEDIVPQEHVLSLNQFTH